MCAIVLLIPALAHFFWICSAARYFLNEARLQVSMRELIFMMLFSSTFAATFAYFATHFSVLAAVIATGMAIFFQGGGMFVGKWRQCIDHARHGDKYGGPCVYEFCGGLIGFATFAFHAIVYQVVVNFPKC